MTTWKGSSRPPEKACMTHYLLPILSATKEWGINRYQQGCPPHQPTHQVTWTPRSKFSSRSRNSCQNHCATMHALLNWPESNCRLELKLVNIFAKMPRAAPRHGHGSLQFSVKTFTQCSVVTDVQKNTPYRTMSLHSLLVVSNFCNSHRID